jgi:hypothetical protein
MDSDNSDRCNGNPIPMSDFAETWADVSHHDTNNLLFEPRKNAERISREFPALLIFSDLMSIFDSLHDDKLYPVSSTKFASFAAPSARSPSLLGLSPICSPKSTFKISLPRWRVNCTIVYLVHTADAYAAISSTPVVHEKIAGPGTSLSDRELCL